MFMSFLLCRILGRLIVVGTGLQNSVTTTTSPVSKNGKSKNGGKHHKNFGDFINTFA
jgi:hypothetical protein